MTVQTALPRQSRSDHVAIEGRRRSRRPSDASPWRSEADRRAGHRLFAIPLTVIAILLQWNVSLGLPGQVAFMTMVVATLGIPHGALDDLLALPYLPARWGLARLPVFVAAYLTVSTAVVAIWLLAPIPSLLCFLILSIIHFGSGDAPPHREGSSRWISVASRGFLPILLPPLLHPVPVAEIFGWLVGGPVAASTVFQIAAVVLPLALIAWAAELIGIIRQRGNNTDGWFEASEMGALALLFALTPPLFSFAIYFGFWHSTRHILDIVERLPERPHRSKVSTFLALASPLTLATLVMAGAAVFALTVSGVDLPRGTATVVFIGLAALTVPHMILTAANQDGELERRPAVLST